ncbi:hypothetical protein ACFYSH_14620 [Streptomyces sp. NPDC005791]|uniref:hypothetical protein n=1 Tax=Streptomyces sp. NPDC005791 TaxID=3364732 RepID=UPI0036A668E3
MNPARLSPPSRKSGQARTAEPPRHAFRLRATDTSRTCTFGPGEPVAEISGTAERLLLMLWGRPSADDASISWSGDRAAGAAALAGPLTP